MNRKNWLCLALLFSGIAAFAQSDKPGKVFVADKVIAVVGEEMILYSDLVMMEEYYKYQNRIPASDALTDDERADLLNSMLLQKLLATQGRIDSLEVSPIGLENMAQEREEMFIEQYGSVENVERIRNKPMFVIRDDIRKQIEEQALADEMRNAVIANVTVTPSEVNRIVRGMDDQEIPLIPVQYSYSQIVKKAPSTDADKLAVKEELLKLRERVLNGDNFAALARMYSDDQASAIRGGDMDYQSPRALVTEYSDAMVSLQPGQISNVVETEYGQHIIQLVDKKGDKYRTRHILMRTKFTVAQLQEAMKELDSIRNVLVGNPGKFAEMASEYSDDGDSKNDGGRVINDSKSLYMGLRSKTDKFYIDELGNDYAYLRTLEVGQLSQPYQTYDELGNLVCKIVRLDRVYPEHKANVRDDYTVLADLALEKRKQEVFNEWLDDKVGTLYIKLEEPYRSYRFKEVNWVK